DDDVAALLVGRDRFDRVALLGVRHGCAAGQRQREACKTQGTRHGSDGDHLVFSLLSCSSSFDMRSTQSPAASCTISLIVTASSVTAVISPKFWPACWPGRT